MVENEIKTFKGRLLGHLVALFCVFGTICPLYALASETGPQDEDTCAELLAPKTNALVSIGKRIGSHLLGLSKLLKMYEAAKGKSHTPEEFWALALDTLQVKVNLIGELSQISAKGRPLVVVSNHPYGLLDGVTLSHIVSQRRDDYLILGNSLLNQIPEISPKVIALDILQGKPEERQLTMEKNKAAIERATEHVKAGGALIVFPSGTVATSENMFDAHSPTVDSPWQNTVGKIVINSKASVLPVHFQGKNSFLFHLVSKFKGKIREALRIALLPRELLNKMGQSVTVRLGHEIPFFQAQIVADQNPKSSPKAITDLLRKAVYSLEQKEVVQPLKPSPRARDLEPIDAPLNLNERTQILNDLIENGKAEIYREDEETSLYRIKGGDLGKDLLHHLGVLREVTFREVGEGSGKSSDIDEFDLRYDHLLIWNKVEKDIVGAYRMGSYEKARATGQYDLMYTHSQFQYSPEFFKQFEGGMLEMGRSFVVSRHQNNPKILSMLWGGIGEYLYRNENFRHMCGPVSVSGTYSDLSKTLMKAFFMKHHGDTQNLKRFLNPERLFPNEVPITQKTLAEFLKDFDRISTFDTLIESIEGQGRGLPPLVKHYPGLLNAKFIEASEDLSFNTLDFFICVDLKDLNERKAGYFIGDKAKAKVLAERFN